MPLTAPGIALALAISAAQDPAALAHRVQTYYEKTKDIEANFVQTYTYAAAMHGQTSSGMLRAKKPGKLRWDYLEPAKKTIVVNGSRLVQYEPEANQAYLDEHFDASAMSAAVTFLL
ncbi:MAG TPA: outer membrane lipoprotein carrier protein LolA, partial [Anaeromyxobacteraceae bacterium]|nr:outer membrane lipoprotein carrier protein LolA [Anaeromyxobacteraceae bacterium]